MDALSLADYLEADADAEQDRVEYESSGALAAELYPGTVVQTPALEMLDDALVDVADGGTDRLMWFMPPQEGKSQRVSRWFPLWMLLRNPDLRIGIASYELGVARRWGRSIRNEIKAHPELGLTVRRDTSAAHEWELEGHTGGVFCTGVGGPLTGRPIDLMIIDDPVKGRAEADSEAYRQTAKDWWQETVSARLGERTPIVLVMCMTGDTPVLMGDGTERPLREIRPGDTVATYENGSVTTATVRNWANQGPDSIYIIRMKSGTAVRANARHPFLVVQDGVETWQRTDMLKPGSLIQRVTGGNGAGSPAPPMAATSLRSARECATRTTTDSGGRAALGRLRSILKRVAQHAFATAMALIQPTMTGWSQSRAASAPSASSRRPVATRGRTGTESSASITATTPDGYAGCSVTTATSSSATGGRRPISGQRLTTCAIEADEVIEVVPCGTEDVYDLQIDRTENFIANGLVSHNTRWHEDDLAGWLVTEHPDTWRVVNIPALAEHDPAKGETDPLGREPGEWLVSARGRTVAGWEQRRIDFGERGFTALCQGRPSPAEGAILKRGWWRFYRQRIAIERDDRSMWCLDMDEIVQSWDMTFKDTKGSDYVVGGVLGRKGPNVYLLDIVRDRMDFPTTCRAFEAMTAKWPQARAKLVEDKANGPAVISELSTRIGGIIAIEPHGSKLARASAVSPYIEGGNVYLPDPLTTPWVATFVEECAGFPNAAHDDQVDMLTQGLDRLMLHASAALSFMQQLTGVT